MSPSMLKPLLITMPVTHDQNIDFVALVEATNANLKSYNKIYTYQDFLLQNHLLGNQMLEPKKWLRVWFW